MALPNLITTGAVLWMIANLPTVRGDWWFHKNKGDWYIHKGTCHNDPNVVATISRAVQTFANLTEVHARSTEDGSYDGGTYPYVGQRASPHPDDYMIFKENVRWAYYGPPRGKPSRTKDVYVYCDDAFRFHEDRRCMDGLTAYVEVYERHGFPWRPLGYYDYYVYLCPPYWKLEYDLVGYMQMVKDGKAWTDHIDGAAASTTVVWGGLLYKMNRYFIDEIADVNRAEKPSDVLNLAYWQGIGASRKNAPSYVMEALGLFIADDDRFPNRNIPLPAPPKGSIKLVRRANLLPSPIRDFFVHTDATTSTTTTASDWMTVPTAELNWDQTLTIDADVRKSLQSPASSETRQSIDAVVTSERKPPEGPVATGKPIHIDVDDDDDGDCKVGPYQTMKQCKDACTGDRGCKYVPRPAVGPTTGSGWYECDCKRGQRTRNLL